MQGWHYNKGLIYLRAIFRLTKSTFLKPRAIQKENQRFGKTEPVRFNYASCGPLHSKVIKIGQFANDLCRSIAIDLATSVQVTHPVHLYRIV